MYATCAFRVFFFGEELGATASFIYNNTDTAETLHYRDKLVGTVKPAACANLWPWRSSLPP